MSHPLNIPGRCSAVPSAAAGCSASSVCSWATRESPERCCGASARTADRVPTDRQNSGGRRVGRGQSMYLFGNINANGVMYVSITTALKDLMDI